jgi:hypothetical protein
MDVIDAFGRMREAGRVPGAATFVTVLSALSEVLAREPADSPTARGAASEALLLWRELQGNSALRTKDVYESCIRVFRAARDETLLSQVWRQMAADGVAMSLSMQCAVLDALGADSHRALLKVLRALPAESLRSVRTHSVALRWIAAHEDAAAFAAQWADMAARSVRPTRELLDLALEFWCRFAPAPELEGRLTELLAAAQALPEAPSATTRSSAAWRRVLDFRAALLGGKQGALAEAAGDSDREFVATRCAWAVANTAAEQGDAEKAAAVVDELERMGGAADAVLFHAMARLALLLGSPEQADAIVAAMHHRGVTPSPRTLRLRLVAACSMGNAAEMARAESAARAARVVLTSDEYSALVTALAQLEAREALQSMWYEVAREGVVLSDEAVSALLMATAAGPGGLEAAGVLYVELAALGSFPRAQTMENIFDAAPPDVRGVLDAFAASGAVPPGALGGAFVLNLLLCSLVRSGNFAAVRRLQQHGEATGIAPDLLTLAALHAAAALSGDRASVEASRRLWSEKLRLSDSEVALLLRLYELPPSTS